MMNLPENVFENETAFDLLIRLGAEGLFLNTCVPTLNPILELHPGKCYEIDGEIGVGKTQICYSLAAKFLLTKKTARIGWISAIPLRTDHFCRHLLSDEGDSSSKHHILERIVCKQVEKIAELRDSLHQFSETVNMQLVVVENIDALLHDTAYHREMGRSVQLDVAERLRKLTRTGVTVVVTNHITHWRGYPAPALGVFWASQITNRFYVEKRSDDSDVRVVSSMKDGVVGTTRVEFRINKKGLQAVEE